MTDAKTAHIVETPQYFFFLRIAQFVLSIIILGCVGYTIDSFGGGRNVSAYLEELSFLVFCCVWTWLVIAYVFVSTLWLPVAYNMWGHLAAEVLATLFWFCGWAAAAAWVADNAPPSEVPAKYKKWWSTAAAGAGLGALIWILFMVTTVTFCLRLHRHRKDPANANLSKFGFQMSEKHELGNVAAPPQQPQVYNATPQPQYVPTPSQTPVQYPGVQPTPPPQGWSQSPPPQQQPYAQV